MTDPSVVPEASEPPSAILKILIVSTWRQFCGISTYARDLAKALLKLGHHVVVLAEEGVTDPNEDGFDAPYIDCWRRDVLGYEALIRTVEQEKPDIVSIQHEYGLFPDSVAFEAMVKQLRAKTRVTVTMHTVSNSGEGRGPGAEHDRRCAFAADAAIVHSWAGLDALGKPLHRATPVVHIPHGTAEGRTPMDRVSARAQLQLEQEAFVIASIGFISRDKKWEDTALAIVKSSAAVPGISWIAGGRSTTDRFERMKAWVEGRTVLCKRTVLYPRYLTTDDMDVVFGAADIVVLNSGPTPYSTSGQLHTALAYGMPLVASRVPLYDDADACGRRFDGSVELARVLMKLGKDAEAVAALRKRSREVAATTAWSRVGAMHDQLFRRILANGAFAFAAETDTGEVLNPDAALAVVGERPVARVVA